MTKITYLNGQFVPHEEALVHVDDRGFLFADGVYEFIAVYKGMMYDGEPHLDRLDRSLRELEIPWPVPRDEFRAAIKELIRRNNIEGGGVYLQITRGAAPRDHAFPSPPVPPTSLITVKPFEYPEPDAVAFTPVKVITIPDIRWGRCDIKTVCLLPNCLGKEQAHRAGAYEAVQFDSDGNITEGTSSNAWILTKDGELVTRYLDNAILGGICRGIAKKLAEQEGFKVVERAFSVEEAKSAKEFFLTTTTPMVRPVGWVDDTEVGGKKIGSFTEKLLQTYRARVFAATGDT